MRWENANLIGSRQNIREHNQGFVIYRSWCMIKTAVCVRDMDILCLGTVDQVAKDPAPIFTVGRQATFTVVAGITSCYARDDNLVSYLKVRNRIADFFTIPIPS